MIKVAVIGTGYLGQHHARIFSELAREHGGVRLAAVVDVDKGRAASIADKYGCEACTDYREAVAKADAFSIVTPTAAHYDIAMDCIRSGKDVLIEKPITSTLEEADRLIKASEEAGVIVQVGHLERFNPIIAALPPLLDSPSFIEAERLSPFQGRGIDVDITVDLMIHDIDIVLSLLGGRPSGIRAAGARMLTGNIDFAKAWLDFDGAHAVFTASRIAPEKSRKLTVFQRESYLVVDYQEMEIKKFFRKGDTIMSESVRADRKEPLKEELRDFVKCIEERTGPRVSALTGRNALDIALRISSKIRSSSRWATV